MNQHSLISDLYQHHEYAYGNLMYFICTCTCVIGVVEIVYKHILIFVLKGGMGMKELSNIADNLKLLGDKTRLAILTLLKEREWCVCEFVEIFDMSQPAISQHLRKLKAQGIVKEDKRGQWVYYSLHIEDKPYIQAVLDQMPDSKTILSQLNKSQINIVCE